MQPSHSLVRYDNPVLVSRTDAAAKGVGGAGAGAGAGRPAAAGQPSPAEMKKMPGGPKKLPPVDDKGRAKSPTQTEDILNSILPPRFAENMLATTMSLSGGSLRNTDWARIIAPPGCRVLRRREPCVDGDADLARSSPPPAGLQRFRR
nr:hypothetical protein HK105_003753 [Polyrhizophydium stewartii]